MEQDMSAYSDVLRLVKRLSDTANRAEEKMLHARAIALHLAEEMASNMMKVDQMNALIECGNIATAEALQKTWREKAPLPSPPTKPAIAAPIALVIQRIHDAIDVLKMFAPRQEELASLTAQLRIAICNMDKSLAKSERYIEKLSTAKKELDALSRAQETMFRVILGKLKKSKLQRE